jgi:hypothetical protein
MTLHIDIPTRAQVDALLTSRNPSSVSVYLPTDPASAGQAERIELKNLATEAERQLRDLKAADYAVAEIAAAFADLLDDETFWRYQARSLALFVTPEAMRTFRLPNHLVSLVQVSDRFHLKPLLRSITFPQAAFVLALAENSVRLLELVAGDSLPWVVAVPDLPVSAADATGQPPDRGQAPRPKVRSSQGQKLRLGQYARQIDRALRPLLSGLDVPLILAAAQPVDSIYRSANSYPYLVPGSIPGNPESTPDAELASAARSILDHLRTDELRASHELYQSRQSDGRVAQDIADVARAATYGAVDTVFVDIDEVVPGSIDENTGAVTFSTADDAASYSVIDEITRRVWLSGGRVLAVRRDDIPGQNSVAAILRYAPMAPA